jgi:predicted esterase
MLGKVLVCGALTAGLVLAACGGDSDSDDKGSPGGSGGSGNTSSGGAAGTTAGGSAGTSSGGGGTGGSSTLGRCGDTPPPGATLAAAPPAYSGGTCPALKAYDGTPESSNTITTAGGERKFLIVAPTTIDPSKKLPVIFLWHWLGGEAKDFWERAEIQAAVDTQHFIAVLPEKKGDVLFVWPVEILSSAARVEEEAKFFDDMLACVSQAYSIDENCISSAGVSAGALWTPQLASARSQHIASMIVLSGGTGGVIKPWGHPQHKMPAIVLWGGPTDNCQGLLSFESLSADLEDNLTADGHFFLECIHNCGHSEPPFEGPPGFSKYKALWDFAFDHPYWLNPGESPYKNGIPSGMPEWCGVGKGSATPRTGECIDPSQC